MQKSVNYVMLALMVNVWTKKIFFFFLVVILIIYILFISANKTENNVQRDVFSGMAVSKRESVIIKDFRISVDIADTHEKKARGLSGKLSLAEDEGMFFIFDESGRFSFWMKDMNFPIDIIWIDGEFKVVDITKNAVPGSFPNTFQPRLPVQYVLETVAGWTDKKDVKIGDTVLLGE